MADWGCTAWSWSLSKPTTWTWRRSSWPSRARLSFCCTPLSLSQAFQHGWRGDVSEVTVSPTAKLAGSPSASSSVTEQLVVVASSYAIAALQAGSATRTACRCFRARSETWLSRSDSLHGCRSAMDHVAVGVRWTTWLSECDRLRGCRSAIDYVAVGVRWTTWLSE